MKEIPANQEIPIPEGLEQRLGALVDRLEAREQQAQRLHARRTNGVRHVAMLAAAAALVAVGFLLLVPEVRSRRELARYAGSYVVVDGQRIDDLARIRADIHEALASARQAEDAAPDADVAAAAERAILQAADDPEMRATIQRILN